MPPKSKKILITGSRGFVGKNLLVAMRNSEFQTQELNRSDVSGTWDHTTSFSGLDLRCDTLIHLAARVHVLREKESESTLGLYRETNVEAFKNLLCEGISQGLKRVIFISTSKVLGESTSDSRPFTDKSTPAPQGAYARSKWEAEKMLRDLARDSGLQFVTLRPPLIYGPGVKANFQILAALVKKGMPIPVPSRPNRRSLLSVDNLSRAILEFLDSDALPNRDFLITDGPALSTNDLVRALAGHYKRKARVVRIPEAAQGFLLKFPTLKNQWLRLSGSFELQDDELCKQLPEWAATRTSTAENLKQGFGL